MALLGGLYVLAFLAGLAITEKRNAVVAFAGYAFGVFAAQAYGLTGYSDSLIGVCFSAAFGIPIMPAFLAGDGLVRLLRMRRGS